STEISNLVSGKNGVRFAIRKMVELPPRGAVIQPLTQFILHSLLGILAKYITTFICKKLNVKEYHPKKSD
ncbi:hypothetical protein, partial [Sphingobacterium cavernae]|uniref:hypothetical protein n=1 Tax=Sphingobacterium cavernae TaxID=2592657 RepID=UPI001CB878B6